MRGWPGQAGGAQPQIWRGDRPALTLATITHQLAGNTGATKFRVYTPDSRLRVKVSVIFLRDDPGSAALPVTDHAATLYLGGEDHDFSGKLGAEIITTDILRDSSGAVIHQSAPLAIPEDVGLEGFSMEFTTAADSVVGIFVTGQAGPSGHWVLQVRYQPDGQRLCPEDWDAVAPNCHAALVAEVVTLGVVVP